MSGESASYRQRFLAVLDGRRPCLHDARSPAKLKVRLMLSVPEAPEVLGTARTLLFTPADAPARLAKAFASVADIVIADLEDAVAPSSKEAARASLEQFAWPDRPGPLRGVRVNAPGTPEHAADLELVARIAPDLIMVPKASSAALRAGEWPAALMPIIETAEGVREAYDIARCPGVALLLFGSIDLSTTLGVGDQVRDDALLFARSSVVLDAAAAGLRPPMDGVHLGLGDPDALEEEAVRARALGFGGKACVHPDQLEIVARCFAPRDTEVDWARRVVAAAGDAESQGRGATVVDGALVDAPVLARARAVLEHATRKSDQT
ncbi:MAG: HpcH/HpaI aldolase/citrate lyase family protein [Solirubrobacteraceae bacterium]